MSEFDTIYATYRPRVLRMAWKLTCGRMNHGWSAERAVNEPVAKRESHGTSIRRPATRGSEARGFATRGFATLFTKRALDLCGEILRHTGSESKDSRHADETEALRADLAQLLQEIECDREQEVC